MSEVTISCPCPGTPHPDGDTITLRQFLGFLAARAIRFEVGLLYADGQPVPAGLMLAKLSEQYALYGIEAWTLVDEKRKPLDLTRANIAAFMEANQEAAEAVADAADDLYAEAVAAPLLKRASASLQPTPTDDSTSLPTDSSPTPLKRSRRSSTTSSPTAATETTSVSPAGDSNSSPSSASAA